MQDNWASQTHGTGSVLFKFKHAADFLAEQGFWDNQFNIPSSYKKYSGGKKTGSCSVDYRMNLGPIEISGVIPRQLTSEEICVLHGALRRSTRLISRGRLK